MDGLANEMWWHAPEETVAAKVYESVRRMETAQSEFFERMHKLEVLYDPNTPLYSDDGERHGGVHENAIASNVDTVSAIIATSDIRVDFETDGADWAMQRRSRKLELYAEEQHKLLGTLKRCRGAFKESAKKGNGLTKVTERFEAPCVEQVFVENVVVDPNECRDGRTPRQMHEWVTVDADELIARYPGYEREILAARARRETWRIDGRWAPSFDNTVMYLDSYRLPIGTKGRKGYRPGRHTETLPGTTVLLDEKWGEGFPYATIVWTERAKSWYGISGAERIAGIQRALNKRNWQIEKQNDNVALPTQYVRPADANMAVRTSKIGQVAVCKAEYPKTVTAVAVNAETYQSRIDLRNSAGEEFGQSRMATHGAKPSGLDSAVALREFKDQTSDRFAPQEAAFEQLFLDTTELVLRVCKKLGAKAPTVTRSGRFGTKTIKWTDVDMRDVRVQMQVASSLPRTPAGRLQFVMELAQAGIITTDSATRLLQHPDIEGELSLYTAAIESAEECFDEIAEGHVVTPEPFMSLDVLRWRGQREYLKWSVAKAPEVRLEALRDLVVTAVLMGQGGIASADGASANPANANAAPGASAAPGAMPAMPQANPSAGTPAAALAPTAMNLVAGTG